jgi:two-component system chemotaxis sensor kinase CheA
MERIAELSHRLENLLDLLRRGERHTDSAVMDLLIAANDRLGVLVADLSQHQQERAAIDDLIEQVDALTGKVEPLSAEAVLPDSAVESDASDSETYEDEYDEELFGIFADQLKDGLQALARVAGPMQSDRDL